MSGRQRVVAGLVHRKLEEAELCKAGSTDGWEQGQREQWSEGAEYQNLCRQLKKSIGGPGQGRGEGLGTLSRTWNLVRR